MGRERGWTLTSRWLVMDCLTTEPCPCWYRFTGAYLMCFRKSSSTPAVLIFSRMDRPFFRLILCRERPNTTQHRGNTRRFGHFQRHCSLGSFEP